MPYLPPTAYAAIVLTIGVRAAARAPAGERTWFDLFSGQVTCEIDPGAESALVRLDGDPDAVFDLLIALPPDALDRALDLHTYGQERPARGGRLVFHALLGSPEIELYYYGQYARRDLIWEGDVGRCDRPVALEERRTTRLTGQVSGRVEPERTFVSVCGLATLPVSPGGAFSGDVMLPERACRLQAYRRDGGRHGYKSEGAVAYGEAVSIAPWSEPATDLALDVPEDEAGGLGLVVSDYSWGLRVDAVYAGLPADAAGLRYRDWIEAVDGAPLEGRPREQIERALDGAVGSAVTLDIYRPVPGHICPAEHGARCPLEYWSVELERVSLPPDPHLYRMDIR